jgi:hypothetical protein
MKYGSKEDETAGREGNASVAGALRILILTTDF